MLGVCIALLLATPLFNFNEIATLITGVSVRQNTMTTPAYIKAIKDAGMLVLMAIAGWMTLRQMSSAQKKMLPAFGFVALAVAASAVYTLLANPINLNQRVFLVMAGARWFLPIVLAWALIGKIDPAFMRGIARVAALLFLGSFIVQLVLAFYAINGYGFNQFGLPERVSGVFLVANTAGFYACLAAFLAYFYLQGSPLRLVVLALTPVSIFFTQSGGAYMGLALLLWLVPLGKKFLRARLILMPVLGIGMLLSLQFLTARSDLLRVSGQGRLNIFAKSITASGIVSNQFGTGTNSGVMLRSVGVDAQAQITDSFYTSVVTNTGAFGLLAVVVFLGLAFFLCLRFAWKTGRIEPLAFLALYTSFGATTSFTEAFPMNLLLAVWVGRFAPALLAPNLAPDEVAPRRKTPRWEWGVAGVFTLVCVALFAPVALYEARLMNLRWMISGMNAQMDAPTFAQRAAYIKTELPDIAKLQPQRPNTNAVAFDLAKKYGERGDWSSAIAYAGEARDVAPRDYYTLMAARDVYMPLNDLILKNPRLVEELKPKLKLGDLIELGHYASNMGQNIPAAMWYQAALPAAATRPEIMRDMWQRVGVAYALGFEYDKAMSAFEMAQVQPPGTSVNIISQRYYPSMPMYLGYVDLFTGVGCQEARADRTADALLRDPNYILRLAEVAWIQGRWEDASRCYALRELSVKNKNLPSDEPDVLFRKAVSAALSNAPDAAGRIAKLGAEFLPAPGQLRPLAMPPTENWQIFNNTAMPRIFQSRENRFVHSALAASLVKLEHGGAYRINAQLAAGQPAIPIGISVDGAAPVEAPITATLTAGYHQIVVMFDQPASQPAPALQSVTILPAP